MRVSDFFLYLLFLVPLLVSSILLAQYYTRQLTQVFLTTAGGLSLWMISVLFYASFVTTPVPIYLGILILPIVSLAVVALVIYKIPKVKLKRKRKNSE